MINISPDRIWAFCQMIQPYLTGGLGVFFVTQLISWQRNWVQKVKLSTKDQGIISTVPVTRENQSWENCYWIEFELFNCANRDLDCITFRISFVDAQVIKCQARSKFGDDKLEQSGHGTKEIAIVIRHFNRRERIHVRLEIANLNSQEYLPFIDGVSGVVLDHKSPKQIKQISKLIMKQSPTPWDRDVTSSRITKVDNI